MLVRTFDRDLRKKDKIDGNNTTERMNGKDII